MPRPPHPDKGLNFSCRIFAAALLTTLFLLTCTESHASASNRLYRIEVKPRKDYTRLLVSLEKSPRYTLSLMPGRRLRLVIADTEGPLFKKFRRYSDTRMGGVAVSRRGDSLMLTFQIASAAGWREVAGEGMPVIVVDVGSRFAPTLPRPLAERQQIWTGAEKLVRDFEPPVKSEIPFIPTDRQILKAALNEADQQAFVSAEGSLYKGQVADVEEVFRQFAAKNTPVKSLALYRLGETLYKLNKYQAALEAFKEAVRIWPDFLEENPGAMFCYGDSIVRSGDLSTGRMVISRLIARLADKKYSPILLVRLGDILMRQGHEQEALALYRTVSTNFDDNKANRLALMKLADQEFLKVAPHDYKQLSNRYLDISERAGDISMREEAFFKHAFLESINGDPAGALEKVVFYQKRFPKGVYINISRNMREVLAGLVYAGTNWKKNSQGLITFAEENREFLSSCMQRPGFLKDVVQAYESSGHPIELIKLLTFLADRQWAASQAPEMLEKVADNAEILGDTTMAENTISSFLKKYPANPKSRSLMEKLGKLQFDAGRYSEARNSLQWIMNKKEKASQPESYYMLARCLLQEKSYKQAAEAAGLFVRVASPTSPLMPDTLLTLASANESMGNRKAALAALESGVSIKDNPRIDQFRFKLGEGYLAVGRRDSAKAVFEKILKEGKDPDWQKLASQSLASLGVPLSEKDKSK